MERSMQIPLIGGCQCSKLRYELSETPRRVYCCHCTSCQKITASAFSITAVVIEEAFHLTAGQPHAVQRTADSGRVYAYWVCPDCGSCVTGAPRVAGAFRGVIGRYIVAAANGTYLDAQQAAMGPVARRRSAIRDSAG